MAGYRGAYRSRSAYGRRDSRVTAVAVLAAGAALVSAGAHAAHAKAPVHSAAAQAAALAPGAETGTASADAALGQSLAGADGWGAGSQWTCLDELWTRESGWRMVWNYGGSGAYGIPQALPASKMASAGADYMTDPATQIRWGLGYIASAYGSPCGAWAHETEDGWY